MTEKDKAIARQRGEITRALLMVGIEELNYTESEGIEFYRHGYKVTLEIKLGHDNGRRNIG